MTEPDRAAEAAAPPEPPRAAGGAGEVVLVLPSDRWPLLLLTGLIACFLVYFGRGVPVDDRGLSAKLAPAGADETYELAACNQTSEETLYVAVAYFDARKGEWTTRGWFPQEKGQCRTLMRRLSAPVYVYAETKDGRSRWRGAPGRGRAFCIHPEKAFVYGAADCTGTDEPHAARKHFRKLATDGTDGVLTWTLSGDLPEEPTKDLPAEAAE
jgi:uncharacterized membrane protein